MKYDVINLKIDPQMKKEAKLVAEGLGLSLSSILKAYLKQLVYTKRVEFSLPHEPSEFLIESIKEAEKDFQAGTTTSFANHQEALDHIDTIIGRDAKKKHH